MPTPRQSFEDENLGTKIQNLRLTDEYYTKPSQQQYQFPFSPGNSVSRRNSLDNNEDWTNKNLDSTGNYSICSTPMQSPNLKKVSVQSFSSPYGAFSSDFFDDNSSRITPSQSNKRTNSIPDWGDSNLSIEINDNMINHINSYSIGENLTSTQDMSMLPSSGITHSALGLHSTGDEMLFRHSFQSSITETVNATSYSNTFAEVNNIQFSDDHTILHCNENSFVDNSDSHVSAYFLKDEKDGVAGGDLTSRSESDLKTRLRDDGSIN
jgi:hypothetical protein